MTGFPTGRSVAPNADDRLARLLQAVPFPLGPRRRVVTIANDDLNAELAGRYEVVRLRAGLVAGIMHIVQPAFVVLQESCLRDAVWVAARDSAAEQTGDFAEIHEWSRDPGHTVVAVRDGSDEFTNLLSSLSHEQLPNRYFFDRAEGGAVRSEIFLILQRYAVKKVLGAYEGNPT